MSQELDELVKEYNRIGERIKELENDEMRKAREEREQRWAQSVTDRYVDNIMEYTDFCEKSFVKVDRLDFDIIPGKRNPNGYAAIGTKLEIYSDGKFEIKPNTRVGLYFGKRYNTVTNQEMIKKLEDLSTKYSENIQKIIDTVKTSTVFRGKNEVSNP